MNIEVIKPGALSTFQDLGRVGFQHLGIPANGAMDERAHRIANALVGNASTNATLEITLMGPTLRFPHDTVIALSGADLDAKLDATPVPLDRATMVPAGSELSFGKRRSGLRAYLAVRGGFRFDPVMGSASTYTRGGYGGHAGRPLKKGDLLAAHAPTRPVPHHPDRTLFDENILSAPDAPIRVLPGREWQYFSMQAQQTFLHEPYRLAPQSDRMGYRLEGGRLDLSAPRDVASEAVGFGAIQVPADGQPIILMADRQTTGGYPKIGHVCAVDLPRLAQKMPGESVHFTRVDLETAQRLLLLQEDCFAALEQHGHG
ncbi:biotin-dependent carboxyltransferase family protein [Paraburkholderia aspalathi]|uniref:5-oxoprolinase subunit C family protein n=1 Tax=Paraburkholderia aspalathi TaxID=1324617 RepID=UPI0038B7647E